MNSVIDRASVVLEGVLTLSDLAHSHGDALGYWTVDKSSTIEGETRVCYRALEKTNSTDVDNVNWSLRRAAAILSKDADTVRKHLLGAVGYVLQPESLVSASAYLTYADPTEAAVVLSMCRQKVQALEISWIDYSKYA